MIITRHFVFVHMPKTGGSFVRSILRQHAPASWGMAEFHDHRPASEVPEESAHLPRFGVIRNPFPWYVSWVSYHKVQFDKGEVHPQHYYARASENGALGFIDTMRNLFELPDVTSVDGPYSRYLQHHFGPGCSLVTLLRCESLREELAQFLQSHASVPRKMLNAISEQPPVNVSRKAHYSEAYDDATRDLVFEKDREVFRAFGYEFEKPR